MESQYIEKSDLIKWRLLFIGEGPEQGIEQVYVWPSIDLLSALNIKGKVTPEMIHKFCSDMLEKEINFVIDVEPVLPKVEINEYYKEKLTDGLSDHFDTFRKKMGE